MTSSMETPKELRKLFEDVKKRLQLYDKQEVADYAGVTTATLNNWLRGAVEMPQARTLFAVADAVGFTISYRLRRELLAA